MKVAIDKGPSGRIRGLSDLVADMNREDVLKAISEFNLNTMGVYGFIDSTDYDLIYEGRRFPPKAIFASATERVVGRTLTSDEFTGGESSTCFQILRKLGFSIVTKDSPEAGGREPFQLEIKKDYSREEISKLFEPDKKFTRGAGTFGISGFIESPKSSGNFIFLVTLTEKHPANAYKDVLSEDGYLDWMSQNRNSIDSEIIHSLLAHDPSQNNIHLFVRGNEGQNYTYLGLLEYFDHDPLTSKPVHFVWHVINWDFTRDELNELGIPFCEPRTHLHLQKTLATKVGQLNRVAPPSTSQMGFPVQKKKSSHKKDKPEVDWASQDANNRKLGLAGEKWVLKDEIRLLNSAGRQDLAQKVKHVALFDSSAGYDIISFDVDGTQKKIEVKTTKGSRSTPFFISINEVLTSSEHPEDYWLYRLFEFNEDVESNQYFALNGSVEDLFHLKPITFKAKAK
jgi:hypothetical protein